MPTATVWSKGDKGEIIRIYLQKTTADQGIIQVATWPHGRNPSVDQPSSAYQYALYQIRAGRGGITCKADLPGPFDPTVGCHLAEAGGKLEVVITLPFYGDTHYPLAQDDFDELTVFLAQSKFPV